MKRNIVRRNIIKRNTLMNNKLFTYFSALNSILFKRTVNITVQGL